MRREAEHMKYGSADKEETDTDEDTDEADKDAKFEIEGGAFATLGNQDG